MTRALSGALAAVVIGLFLGFAANAQVLQAPQGAPQDADEGPASARPAPARVTTMKASRTETRTVKVEVPIEAAARSDTPAFRGEGWFQQKCGLCHLGRWRKAGQLQPSAPPLAGVLRNASPDREAAVRAFIRAGSSNMPGFANALTATEFEDLMAYLRTL